MVKPLGVALLINTGASRLGMVCGSLSFFIDPLVGLSMPGIMDKDLLTSATVVLTCTMTSASADPSHGFGMPTWIATGELDDIHSLLTDDMPAEGLPSIILASMIGPEGCILLSAVNVSAESARQASR